ncbi:hypothetical protein ANCDUO_00029 [Ancylostoma duodenale]|uniref:Uncharacterized protein n=1 Tax=Ancylostoma duodenale TaxID=51022 RepID=A0A0C2HJ43_9BILA|nr:hypothetical protein ANCDUO_00029 [Ancylostoma duodenale]
MPKKTRAGPFPSHKTYSLTHACCQCSTVESPLLNGFSTIDEKTSLLILLLDLHWPFTTYLKIR